MSGPPFQRIALLVEIGVSIVDAADPADDMAQYPLGRIGVDAERGKPGPHRPPRVVQPPAANLRPPVECGLRLAVAGKPRAGAGREDESVAYLRQGSDQRHGG